MENVISSITLKNLAFNKKDTDELPKEVLISTNLDNRYMVSIKVGDWETKISKDDLRRLV